MLLQLLLYTHHSHVKNCLPNTKSLDPSGFHPPDLVGFSQKSAILRQYAENVYNVIDNRLIPKNGAVAEPNFSTFQTGVGPLFRCSLLLASPICKRDNRRLIRFGAHHHRSSCDQQQIQMDNPMMTTPFRIVGEEGNAFFLSKEEPHKDNLQFAVASAVEVQNFEENFNGIFDVKTLRINATTLPFDFLTSERCCLHCRCFNVNQTFCWNSHLPMAPMKMNKMAKEASQKVGKWVKLRVSVTTVFLVH